jgi:hypothetical protein
MFAGGVPLRRDGSIIGGIGVSGGSGKQDDAVAVAGASALAGSETRLSATLTSRLLLFCSLCTTAAQECGLNEPAARERWRAAGLGLRPGEIMLFACGPGLITAALVVLLGWHRAAPVRAMPQKAEA